jgi:hypothetical protein
LPAQRAHTTLAHAHGFTDSSWPQGVTYRVHIPSFERLQASAVRFLIDGGENEAANVLLWCDFRLLPVVGTKLRDDSDFEDLLFGAGTSATNRSTKYVVELNPQW